MGNNNDKRIVMQRLNILINLTLYKYTNRKNKYEFFKDPVFQTMCVHQSQINYTYI